MGRTIGLQNNNIVLEDADNKTGKEIESYLFKVSTGNKKRYGIYNDGLFNYDKKNNRTVIGTYIHGAFNNPVFKNFIIELVAKNLNISIKNREGISFENFKEEQYNRLAGLFRDNIDMQRLYSIMNRGL